MTKIELYGVPYSTGCDPDTSQTVDSHNGPAAVRKAYKDIFENFNIPQRFNDNGDIKTDDTVPSILKVTEDTVSKVLEEKSIPLLLGGAHTLTLGGLRALSKKTNGNFSLIYFDAHPDIMPEDRIYYGSIIHHAIKEGTLKPERLAYLGIRQIEDEESEAIKKHNILSYSSLELSEKKATDVYDLVSQKIPGPYYVSFDIDAIDPTHAPAVSTPYPLGLTSQLACKIALEFLKKDTLALDIVEVAPKLDVNELTSRLTASILQEFTNTLHQANDKC